MRRSSVAAGILVIALLITAYVGILVILEFNQNQKPDFQWAVSMEDELFFSVVIHGENTTYEYNYENESQIYYRSPLSIAALNESIIVAKVVMLPEIPSVANESSFTELVRTQKVECTYMNGSEISVSHCSWLNLLVSTSLLPINGWSFLDNLYPSPPSHTSPSGNNQYTRMFDSHFQIVDVWGGVEAGYWAQGNTSLENGSPIEGYLRYGNYLPHDITETYSWYHFEIELALFSQ